MCNFSIKTIILVWFNLLVVIFTNSFYLFGIKAVILNVIMNITRFFDKNSKKRDLSGNSNPDEKRENQRW